MTEEQIKWLKENIRVEFRTHGWCGGVEAELIIGDEVVSSDWLYAVDIREGAGLEPLND